MAALRIDRDGPVLRVMLARPERRNAFDAALIAELTEAFSDVGDARAVVLAGDGPSFCAGADVDWQRSAIDLTYDENVEDAMRLYAMLEAIDGCPAPVVARVQGYALGGGSGLVACVDIALAGEDAVFGFSEVKLGIIPAVISPFVLPRIGAGAARRYFLTGERFDAQAALRIGAPAPRPRARRNSWFARRRPESTRRTSRPACARAPRVRTGSGPSSNGARRAGRRSRACGGCCSSSARWSSSTRSSSPR